MDLLINEYGWTALPSDCPFKRRPKYFRGTELQAGMMGQSVRTLIDFIAGKLTWAKVMTPYLYSGLWSILIDPFRAFGQDYRFNSQRYYFYTSRSLQKHHTFVPLFDANGHSWAPIHPVSYVRYPTYEYIVHSCTGQQAKAFKHLMQLSVSGKPEKLILGTINIRDIEQDGQTKRVIWEEPAKWVVRQVMDPLFDLWSRRSKLSLGDFYKESTKLLLSDKLQGFKRPQESFHSMLFRLAASFFNKEPSSAF